MALLNTGQPITVPNETATTSVSLPKINVVTYMSRIVGNCYDPDEHIYLNSSNAEQDCYKLVATDDDFALYLNYPVYLEMHIPYGYKMVDTVTKQEFDCKIIYLSKTIFDMDTPENYKKLETPRLNEYGEPGRLIPVQVIPPEEEVTPDVQ